MTNSSQGANVIRTRDGVREGTIQAVHVISRKTLKDAATRHADVEASLDTWYRTAKKAQWKSLSDVRKTYAHADAVGEYTVFNIKGNAYRLIVKIEYGVRKGSLRYDARRTSCAEPESRSHRRFMLG